MKKALIGEPLLYTPNIFLPFRDWRLEQRAVQHVRRIKCPIVYISTKLLKQGVRYSTKEKDCLVIRWVVNSLFVLPPGLPFHPQFTSWPAVVELLHNGCQHPVCPVVSGSPAFKVQSCYSVSDAPSHYLPFFIELFISVICKNTHIKIIQTLKIHHNMHQSSGWLELC